MIRRAAAALRAAWPFDSWDVVGAAALVGLGVGIAGWTGQVYAGVTVVSALVVTLALLVVMQGQPPAKPEA